MIKFGIPMLKQFSHKHEVHFVILNLIWNTYVKLFITICSINQAHVTVRSDRAALGYVYKKVATIQFWNTVARTTKLTIWSLLYLSLHLGVLQVWWSAEIWLSLSNALEVWHFAYINLHVTYQYLILLVIFTVQAHSTLHFILFYFILLILYVISTNIHTVVLNVHEM